MSSVWVIGTVELKVFMMLNVTVIARTESSFSEPVETINGMHCQSKVNDRLKKRTAAVCQPSQRRVYGSRSGGGNGLVGANVRGCS